MKKIVLTGFIVASVLAPSISMAKIVSSLTSSRFIHHHINAKGERCKTTFMIHGSRTRHSKRTVCKKARTYTRNFYRGSYKTPDFLLKPIN